MATETAIASVRKNCWHEHESPTRRHHYDEQQRPVVGGTAVSHGRHTDRIQPLQSGRRPTPYSGQTQAGLSDQSQQALNQTQAVANGQGGVLGQSGLNLTNNVINDNGISQNQQGALGTLGNAANGGMQIDGSGYQGLINQAQGPSSSQQNFRTTPPARTSASPTRTFSPPWRLRTGRRPIASTGSSRAAGRYGSGAQTDVLSRNIGEQNNNAYMNDYEQQANRQLQANQQIDASRQGLLGVQGQGLAGLAGIQGQNVTNQLGAATGLNNAYAQGQNTALGAAMNGGQITSQLYNPSQMLAGVGQAYDDRAQNQLNSTIDLYNAQQQQPWNNVAQFNAIASGAGQFGSTGTQTQIKPGQSQLQQLLGYGSTGLGLLGKL
jgi:hypothetical protein